MRNMSLNGWVLNKLTMNVEYWAWLGYGSCPGPWPGAGAGLWAWQ